MKYFAGGWGVKAIKFGKQWSIPIHSSVPAENRTHVHPTFLTGNYLRNKILKYLNKVTGHCT
jgi:hypothetical protein